MNKHSGASFVSKIRTPQTLSKQASEVFAYNLVVSSLPVIEALSYREPEEADEDGRTVDLRNNSMLNRLKKLKSWYWVDLAEILGECDSEVRCLISKSLSELTCFWNCDPLHRFVLQLLFACEAGNLEDVVPCLLEIPVCRQLSRFLIYISPFYIRGLYDNSLQFCEPLPINLVMANSNDLRRIQLFQNISSSSLNRLRMSCINTETITLDLENDKANPRLVEDDNLFKTFFGNKGRAFVFKLMNRGNAVPRSFSNLKEVCIKCDHIIVSLTLFIQSLHYAYSNVKITVSCMVSVPYDHYIKKYPFVCPTFQLVSRDDGKKNARVFLFSEDIQIDEITGPSSELTVDDDLLLHTFMVFVSDTYYMQNVMSMIQVSNLRYIFRTDMKINMSPRVAISAENHDLFICGPFPDKTTYEDLVESLNRCFDLRVLCFMIKPMIKPVLKGLKPITNLKVLSLYFTELRPSFAFVGSRFPHCQEGPLNEDDVAMFTELLIKAAPNLEVLEAPCIDILIKMSSNGHLQKIHTFSVITGNLENIKSCIMNLPHLKVLLLEKCIEYSVYYELKRCSHYSELQVSYKNGRHALPYLLSC